jgi:anaerobic selenocysteine-containing dehydrogenase
MTDTASMADIILPAKNMFEQSDIIGSYWSPYIQFKPRVIKSPDEVQPESEIYYHLAKRLNLNVGAALIPEPGNENIEQWLEKRISGFSGVTLAQLKLAPVLAPGLQQIAYEDMKFETPSGKIEIYSEEAKAKWNISPLPDYAEIFHSHDIKSFPLILLTPNTGSRIHSQFGNMKIIKESVPDPVIRISPSDAKSRSILSGQKIRVYNINGEMISLAEISNRVPSGVVVFPNGIWFCEGGGINQLIDGHETDIGFGSAFHDTKVEIEKVD